MTTQTPPTTTPASSTPAPSTTRHRSAPTFAQSVLLVAEREIVTTARTRSFQVSAAILVIAVLGSILLGALLSGRETTTTVAVGPGVGDVTAGGVALDEVEGLELVPLDGRDVRELVESGEVEAAVVRDPGSPAQVRVVAGESAPDVVLEALTVRPEVELLDPPSVDDGARYLVSFAFGLVFLMSASGFGSMIAQNTVQEKQSRIVEILLSTVPPRALMAGKILGNSVLAIGQTTVIAAVAVLGLVLTDQTALLSALGAPVVWFVGFFVIGFVLVAGVFAASASLVSRMEDVGSVTGPAMIITMTPYFGVIFFNDNALVMQILSYVPFSSPVAMPTRLFLGEALWWEPVVALVLLVIGAALVVVVGARIYERSLLRMGPRAKLREVLSDR